MAVIVISPGFHAKLVNEGPCAVHLISSYFLQCEGYTLWMLPMIDVWQFILAEYYLTTITFSMAWVNYAAILLGTSWLIEELDDLR